MKRQKIKLEEEGHKKKIKEFEAPSLVYIQMMVTIYCI